MSEFQPDWVSPPGDTLADALEEMAMSVAELAFWSGRGVDYINAIINDAAVIDADMLQALGAIIGPSADFWIRREALYRQGLEMHKSRIRG